MTFNQITIVITSYKSDEKIVKCLKSINNQCKVIIVENSKDYSLVKKVKKFSNAKVIINSKNTGFGAAPSCPA